MIAVYHQSRFGIRTSHAFGERRLVHLTNSGQDDREKPATYLEYAEDDLQARRIQVTFLSEQILTSLLSSEDRLIFIIISMAKSERKVTPDKYSVSQWT